ncbi:MAG: exo-alpha-sialidase, partial [Phycisphaerales bacterium]|nr:exo-alpha-sialidase [Phycisphaerales bacterium]
MMCSRWIPAFVALALTVCCAQAQFPVTISPTATVAASASTDTGQDQGVHLATDRRGRWMAVWSSTDDAGLGLGPDADILFSMSDDDGMTWDVPQALPGMNADVLEDLAPRVTTNRRGTWMITWYANSATDADVYVAVTDDNGQSFSTPRLIDPVMAVDSGDDFLPRLETDTQGVWMVAWQTCDPTGGGLGTDEDIVYARSLDDGETWSAPVAWYAYAATDGSADVNVALATDAQGNWIAAWQSDRNLGGIGVDDDILYVRSADSGMTWSTPLPVASNATTDTGRDLSPALTTDGQCNWVIAWHSTENLGGINTDYDIFRVTSNDNGMTWSAPAVLNGTASGDAAPDFGVNLATDHRGNWVASWTSLDAGGGLGSDSDVLVAHSADAGVTWSMPVPLNDDALTDTGGDEGAVIVADRDGGWIGAWYAYLGMNGSLGSDRDVLTASFFIDLSALDPGPLTPPGAISNMATTDVGGDFRVSLASD